MLSPANTNINPLLQDIFYHKTSVTLLKTPVRIT